MWIGNYDGQRAGLIVASSKEKARKVVGNSRADFDGYWSQARTVDETIEPETLYVRGIDDHRGAWSAVAKRPTRTP